MLALCLRLDQRIQAAMPMPKQQTLLGIQADLPMSEIEADLPISKQSKEPEIQADFSNSKRQIEAENLLEFPVEKNEITNESSNIAAQPMRNEENKVLEVIDLSDDEEDDENEYPGDIDVESYEWYYIDPQGDIQGPFAIASLKRWSDADYFPPSFKVWKTGQGQDEAVLLSDLLEWAYPNY